LDLSLPDWELWRHQFRMSKNMRKEFETVLKDLETTAGDIEGSAVVRTDGLIVAFAMPRNTDETLVAAMSAALLNIGTRTVKELARGDLEKVIVSGTKGDVVLMGAGRDSILSSITRTGANLGLILVEMKKTGSRLSSLMAGGY
jgi:predicted regulator of Ras-like GTPase activity (Roadblock/LC7/MglB family)